jgi:hypothetical protein
VIPIGGRWRKIGRTPLALRKIEQLLPIGWKIH